ncbi:MAG: CBS domain-containing protein [Actinobacteria bacterium]|nr:CBS domain-containing protein [Actinomycetota bacterium]
MRVKDVSAHTLVRMELGGSLREAATELMRNEVGVLVAEDARGVKGILSERDIARAVADDADLDFVQVRDYMTSSPVEVADDAPIEDAIRLMHEHGLRYVIVIQEGRVERVVSARDIPRMLAPDVARIIQV